MRRSCPGRCCAALEDALATRERRFATTLQSIADAVLTTDANDRVMFLNPAAAAILCVDDGEAIGRKVDEVVRFVDARGNALPTLTRLTPAGRSRIDALPRQARLVTTRPGVTPAVDIEIEGSVSPIALDAGQSFGTVMVFRDVSERRKLERRLGMAERMAAIGTMAAGMQHEINNPLASIVANVQFTLEALRNCKDGKLSQEQIAELVTALGDASRVANASAGASRTSVTSAAPPSRPRRRSTSRSRSTKRCA